MHMLGIILYCIIIFLEQHGSSACLLFIDMVLNGYSTQFCNAWPLQHETYVSITNRRYQIVSLDNRGKCVCEQFAQSHWQEDKRAASQLQVKHLNHYSAT